MRLSSTNILFFINVLLAGAASFMGGSLLSTWLHHQVLSIPASQPASFQVETGKLPIDSGKSQQEFDLILERNIFNAQKTNIELPLTIPEEEILTPETTDGETVERTRLAIALAGTMIYGERNSFAFFSKKDNLKRYVTYGIDECFNAITILRDKDCTEKSVKVLSIKDRWVLILYQGKKESLWMVSAVTSGEDASPVSQPKTAQRNTAPKQKTVATIVKKKEKVGVETSAISVSPDVSGNSFHFQRVWVDEQLANFEKLLNDARVVPTTKDDKPYFMFQYIKEDSIYQKLGLKKNDIILEINGFLVDSVGKALKLLEVLQSEREISLKVEREGNPVQFHYYID